MQNVEPYKLLIVDDESGIRDSLKDFFELEGFCVSCSSGGINALEELKNNPFDVVLSDIRMPDGDGRFLLKSIRQIHTSQPLVILMSGFSDVTPEEAYAEGAVALLTKPFNPVEVIERVKAHIDEQKNRWRTVYSAKPQYKLKLESSSIQEAVQKQQISCGQNGLFLKIDPSGYRVGQDIELQFSDSQLVAVGVIRWVRAVVTSDRSKGMGIELKSLTDNLKTQFLDILENQTIAAVIPRI